MTDLPTVNRFAVTLVPTEAYLRWAKSCPDGDANMELDEIRPDPTVYLIPETKSEPEPYLRRHYKTILTEELFSWCTDEAFWPEKLTYKTFQTFFDVHVSSMVFDIAPGPIEKEGGDGA